MWFQKTLKFSLLILLLTVVISYYNKYNENSKYAFIESWSEQSIIKVDGLKPEAFNVIYDDKEWDLLKQKLESTRFFTELHKTPSFQIGFNPEYARELIDYWKTKFDWKKQVNFLNKYSQFRVKINDTIIHYVHHVTNPKAEKKVNLLLLDGWPGSFFGFYEMIDYIEQNFKDTSYSIIVPSIPGYHFSTPLDKEYNTVDTALQFDALMRLVLGSECGYYVHGEDWGSLIAALLAQIYPQRVRGIHLTMPVVSNNDLTIVIYNLLLPWFPKLFLTEEEMKHDFANRFSLSNKLFNLWEEFGYFHFQATKPDTVGHGLTDSPVGLMAYILEKYSSWSFNKSEIYGHKDGGLEKFNKNDLLTICTMYWMSNSITSSIRYYRNSFKGMFEQKSKGLDFAGLPTPIGVPIGVQMNTNELFVVPSWFVKQKYTNLIQYKIFPNGGHFSAFQNPIETAKHFVDFVSLVEV